jgi:hypothetical protein
VARIAAEVLVKPAPGEAYWDPVGSGRISPVGGSEGLYFTKVATTSCSATTVQTS